MQIFRGDPAYADASSLIVPINTNCILRGSLGQSLLRAGGPVPQNELLKKAPVPLGTVFSLQVKTVSSGPSRWYLAVAFDDNEAVDLGLVKKTLSEACSRAVSEGQIPVAVPFFYDGLPNGDILPEIAALMAEVLGDGPFVVITNDEFQLQLLHAVASVSVKVDEAVAGVEEKDATVTDGLSASLSQDESESVEVSEKAASGKRSGKKSSK